MECFHYLLFLSAIFERINKQIILEYCNIILSLCKKNLYYERELILILNLNLVQLHKFYKLDMD